MAKKPVRNVVVSIDDTRNEISGDSEPTISTGAPNGDAEPQVRSAEPENHFDGVPVIDPIEHELGNSGGGDANGSGGSSAGDAPKRRGRPPGYSPSGKQKASNLIADLEALLLSVHFMGAKLLAIPELELDESEAAKLSSSLKNVAKYYSVNIDPKKLAMFELSTTALAIYGPRVIAVVKNHSDHKKEAPKPVAAPAPVAVPKPQAASPAPAPKQVPLANMAPSDLFMKNGMYLDTPNDFGYGGGG